MEKQPLSKDSLMSASVEYHNQRLEFLGDSVLEFVASHHLFRLLPEEEEGGLTDYRSGIVNNKLFAVFASRLGLHSFALIAERTSSGSFWHEDHEAYERMLADTFEAFIGAVYLDKGLTAVRNLFAQVVFPRRADLPLRRCWLQAIEQPYSEPDPLKRDEEDAEHKELIAFENATSLHFERFGLLRQAFTHPSFFHNVPLPHGQKSHPHNQRLEHLGDAVLQLASADYLFHVFPEHREGHLTQLRRSLVNNAKLCDIAATCGMSDCLRYSSNDSTMDAPGRARNSMLADSFEAFIGALFLDRQHLGLAFVKTFTHTMLFDSVTEENVTDPKTRLQQCLNEFNARGPEAHGGVPLAKRFRLIEEFGPSHERMYVVGCYINDVLVAQARGHTFLDAQMGSAMKAMEAIGMGEQQ